MRHYGFRQRQWLTALWFALPAGVLGATLGLLQGVGGNVVWGIGAAWVIAALLLTVLGTFTIDVDDTTLEWRFGWLGRPRWRLPIASIARLEPAESSWFEGWGIRFTREGMLYNASGKRCVRIHTVGGRRLRLGSPDPQRLIAFIEARRRS